MTSRLPDCDELRALGQRSLDTWDEPLLDWSVVYNQRMRTRAGVAWFRSLRIELNPRLLARHPEKLENTLVHELAHLVIYQREGKGAAPHGESWCRLMDLANCSTEPTHQMDVGGLRQRRRSYYYLHLCADCSTWWVARKLRRDLVCERCGPGSVRVYRANRSRSGLRGLKGMAKQHEQAAANAEA